MASIIKEHQDELLKLHQENKLKDWVLSSDLRIWFSEYGKCLMGTNPKEARCHTQAGTNSWDTLTPNYQQRSPSTCLGCKCFAIDGEHKVFWQKRLADNQKILEQTPKSEIALLRLAKERVQQSKSVLNVIDNDKQNIQ